MAFTKDLGLQLYVDDVAKEKEFYKAIDFVIIEAAEMMGYEYVKMKTCAESTVLFTIYANEFIRQVSPEVIDMKPSILFESDNIVELQERISKLTDDCSVINMEPFQNFHFGTPGGMHFAVRDSHYNNDLN